MREMRFMWTRKTKAVATFILIGILLLAPAQKVHAIGAGSAVAKGIDVSKHNLAIDWSQVPSSGIKFAFIKAGSTNSGVDPYFDANMRGANEAGIRTGVYLYSYASNVEEAQNEANQLLSWIGNYTVSFPVVYDVEAAVHKNMSMEQVQAIINTFCSTIEAAGYYPMVYSYKNFFQTKIGNVGYDKWVAQYADTLDFDGAAVWQSTSHGSVAGVPTRVDIDYMFKDYSSIIVADGFATRGDNKVFYSNYRLQRSCWVAWEDRKYHLDENGFVQKGCWFEDETGKYFLATKDGHALREDVTIQGVEYYFDENAVMQTGLVTRPDGNTYYYDTTGALQKNTSVVIDGIEYSVNKKGVATQVGPAQETPQQDAVQEQTTSEGTTEQTAQ